MTISPRSTASTPSPPPTCAAFPGKQITAANTVSIQGTISFRTGAGMQGVNVVARPLDANGNPLYQYTVTSVSGAYFSGNHGNPVTGLNDSNGNPLTMWGSNDPTLAGLLRSQRHSSAARHDAPPTTRSPSSPSIRFTSSLNRSAPTSTARRRPPALMPVLSVPNMSAGSDANSHRQRSPTPPQAASGRHRLARLRRACCRRAACGADGSARWARPTGSPSPSRRPHLHRRHPGPG